MWHHAGSCFLFVPSAIYGQFVLVCKCTAIKIENVCITRTVEAKSMKHICDHGTHIRW